MRKRHIDITLIASVAILALLIGLAVYFNFVSTTPPGTPPITPETPSKTNLQSFNSCDALKDAISERNTYYGGYYRGQAADIAMPMAEQALGVSGATTAKSSGTSDFSQTNVQVEGVDEADIVKNDGKYIYAVTGNEIAISDVFPAENARVLSKIIYSEKFYPSQIFIEEDKLVVFGSISESYLPESISGIVDTIEQVIPDVIPKNERYIHLTSARIYDISDRSDPQLIKKYDFEGYYVTSRKIEDKVYFIVNSYPSGDHIIPLMREDEGELKQACKCVDVSYLDQWSPINYLTMVYINLGNLNMQTQTVVGSAQNVYASQQNLFVAQQDYGYIGSRCGGSFSDCSVVENEERTNLFKFSLGSAIGYQGKTDVKGRILDQFSMDEYDNYFRIATTKGWGDNSENSIYVIDSSLNLVGSLENIAQGERIYSTRFMGKRVYMVTFKQTDPFFVIDLSVPTSPAILGYLKIPGFSEYLHPYDENHIIGVGKETGDESGTWVSQQGVKLALFDVSDVSNPKQLHKEVIGDRGTNSEALQDHKAFLFDRKKNLLVIPVTVYEVQNKSNPWAWGQMTFQGAYVYDLTLYGGFELRGTITHNTEPSKYESQNEIRRSLYMDNNLYTVSGKKIKANSLLDMHEIRTLPFEQITTLDECLQQGNSVSQCCDQWAVDNGVAIPTYIGWHWAITSDGCEIR